MTAQLPPGWEVGAGGFVVRAPVPVPRPPLPRCTVDSCERPAMTSGLCNGHYDRKTKRGDVFAHIPIGTGSRGRLEPPGESTNLVFPGSCGTCGAGDLRVAHADWCARVRAAAPDFVTARYHAAVIAEAEARAARRVGVRP